MKERKYERNRGRKWCKRKEGLALLEEGRRKREGRTKVVEEEGKVGGEEEEVKDRKLDEEKRKKVVEKEGRDWREEEEVKVRKHKEEGRKKSDGWRRQKLKWRSVTRKGGRKCWKMEVGMEERRRKCKWGSAKRKKVVEKEGRDGREEEEVQVRKREEEESGGKRRKGWKRGGGSASEEAGRGRKWWKKKEGLEERRRKSKWGSAKRKKVVEKEGRDWRGKRRGLNACWSH
jgi:hypothetical protein